MCSWWTVARLLRAGAATPRDRQRRQQGSHVLHFIGSCHAVLFGVVQVSRLVSARSEHVPLRPDCRRGGGALLPGGGLWCSSMRALALSAPPLSQGDQLKK